MWIIDPLDGTNGFVNGTDDFAVMLGLIENGEPVLGVVHLPVSNTVYYAVKGMGAYRIDATSEQSRLQVSTYTVPHLRAVGSINHVKPYMHDVAERLGVIENVGVGGIGVKAGVVTQGQAEYFLTLGELGEWDVCAPQIILTEAGGVVTDRHGDHLCYGNTDARIHHGVIFSNGVCHKNVLTVLKEVTGVTSATPTE